MRTRLCKGGCINLIKVRVQAVRSQPHPRHAALQCTCQCASPRGAAYAASALKDACDPTAMCTSYVPAGSGDSARPGPRFISEIPIAHLRPAGATKHHPLAPSPSRPCGAWASALHCFRGAGSTLGARLARICSTTRNTPLVVQDTLAQVDLRRLQSAPTWSLVALVVP